MRKRLACLLLAALLLLTPALAHGAGTGSAVYQNETALAEGLTYEHAVSYTAAGRRVETFTLARSPGSAVYPIVLACDTIYGGMTATQMLAWAEGQGYEVAGIMNADFGYVTTKVPTGMVVEDGVYKSSPEGNNAVGFAGDGTVVSVRPVVTITLENLTRGGTVTTTHLNKTRAADGLYLYSEHFSTVSTRTTKSGWYVRLRLPEGGALSLDGTLELDVVEIVEGETAVPLGAGELVLTASDDAGLEAELAKFRVGDSLRLTTACSDAALAAADWVTGCGNVLAQGGELFEQARWDSSITAANPRTALGVKADGTVLFQVMDGRTSASRGATLEELARDLISQGCETVVNLDGGGSSILRLRLPGAEGWTTVNSPSDGAERAVSSYILFVTEADSDGRASRLALAEDGAYVLAGSALPLTVLATDAALHTAEPPAAVSVAAARGAVADGVYTAPAAAGTDSLRLTAAGGLSGAATLHVVTAADELSVRDGEGRSLSAAVLEPGETLAPAVSARLYLRDVHMDARALSWRVEGEVGTVDENGVFTAAGAPGAEGKLIVEAAGLTREVAIRLAFEFEDMEGHWAAAYVKQLYEAGIVSGVTDTRFAPDREMKRGDFVLMLYRAAGSPEPEAAASFADVPADSYCAKAVAWAEANGIAQGKGEGTFAPGDSLTRQEGFTFLYRALAALGVAYADGDPALLDGFPDGGEVAGWAQVPTATLVSMGVVEGGAAGLDPAGSLTRAQMAKMLASAMAKKA